MVKGVGWRGEDAACTGTGHRHRRDTWRTPRAAQAVVGIGAFVHGFMSECGQQMRPALKDQGYLAHKK